MSSDQPPGLALEILGDLTVRESQARRLEVLARRVPIVEAHAAAGYPARDGRTGLHLTRETADNVLVDRMRAEVRPWVDEPAYGRPLTREALEAAVGRFLSGDNEARPPVPLDEPAQRISSVHAAEGDRGPASPPESTPSVCAPLTPCASPGSLGRHRVPDGAGVRSCPCGLVTRHPAP